MASEPGWRKPTTGIVGGCARADSGHAASEQRDELAAFHCPIPPVLRTKDRIAQHCCAAGFQSGLCLLRVEAGKRKRLDGLYGIDISSMNLRHHWNASSRTSAADVSDLPSVIHSSEACAV